MPKRKPPSLTDLIGPVQRSPSPSRRSNPAASSKRSGVITDQRGLPFSGPASGYPDLGYPRRRGKVVR